jgi:hypothetical protein
VTLIIGIKCREGVVLASDGAVTGTITQQTKKLSIIDNCIVIGSSGPIGLSQRIAGTLEQYCRDGSYKSKDAFFLMTELAQHFRVHVQIEITMAQGIQNLVPGANSIWQSSTLVALPLNGSARLFSFDMTCAPTEAVDSLPYFSIGSGNYLAEPFLAFIKRLLWGGTLPSLSLGIFSAVWALDHAIRTSPGGVSKPMQVIIVRGENSSFQARELSDAELGEPLQAVNSAENSITRAVTELNVNVPTPPDPPVA